jgi:hypothetical protein
VERELGIFAVVHGENGGYGGNQKTCYRLASERGADVIMMLDPDYQNNPKLLTAIASMFTSALYRHSVIIRPWRIADQRELPLCLPGLRAQHDLRRDHGGRPLDGASMMPPAAAIARRWRLASAGEAAQDLWSVRQQGGVRAGSRAAERHETRCRRVPACSEYW